MIPIPIFFLIALFRFLCSFFFLFYILRNIWQITFQKNEKTDGFPEVLVINAMSIHIYLLMLVLVSFSYHYKYN